MGIEMHQTYWGAEEVELLVWDCVGRESHRCMHQHFFHQSHGGSCLYTIVWDISDGEDNGFSKLKRELDQLCAVVADPQVFVVGTHIDKLLDRAVKAEKARRLAAGLGNGSKKASKSLGKTAAAADANKRRYQERLGSMSSSIPDYAADGGMSWQLIQPALDKLQDKAQRMFCVKECEAILRGLRSSLMAACDMCDPTVGGREYYVRWWDELVTLMQPMGVEVRTTNDNSNNPREKKSKWEQEADGDSDKKAAELDYAVTVKLHILSATNIAIGDLAIMGGKSDPLTKIYYRNSAEALERMTAKERAVVNSNQNQREQDLDSKDVTLSEQPRHTVATSSPTSASGKKQNSHHLIPTLDAHELAAKLESKKHDLAVSMQSRAEKLHLTTHHNTSNEIAFNHDDKPLASSSHMVGKTKWLPNTLNPVWTNETFSLAMPAGPVGELCLQVFDHDWGAHNADDFLGQVHLTGKDLARVLSRAGMPITKPLLDRPDKHRGDVKASGELTFMVEVSKGGMRPGTSGSQGEASRKARKTQFGQGATASASQDAKDIEKKQWPKSILSALQAICERLCSAALRLAGKDSAVEVGKLVETMLLAGGKKQQAGKHSKANNEIGGERWMERVLNVGLRGGWLRGMACVSLHSGRGLNSVQDSLLMAVRAQSKFGKAQPAKFLTLEELVMLNRSRFSPPVLEWKQYCSEFGTLSGMGTTELWEASLELHQWGAVHFDPGCGPFGDCVVLDPQWLADGMHCVLEHCLRHNSAHIGMKQIPVVWGKAGFKLSPTIAAQAFPMRLYVWMMYLMEHYQLCYLVRYVDPKTSKKPSYLTMTRRASLKAAERTAKMIEQAARQGFGARDTGGAGSPSNGNRSGSGSGSRKTSTGMSVALIASGAARKMSTGFGGLRTTASRAGRRVSGSVSSSVSALGSIGGKNAAKVYELEDGASTDSDDGDDADMSWEGQETAEEMEKREIEEAKAIRMREEARKFMFETGRTLEEAAQEQLR